MPVRIYTTPPDSKNRGGGGAIVVIPGLLEELMEEGYKEGEALSQFLRDTGNYTDRDMFAVTERQVSEYLRIGETRLYRYPGRGTVWDPHSPLRIDDVQSLSYTVWGAAQMMGSLVDWRRFTE
jgi:hypothetical protein